MFMKQSQCSTRVSLLQLHIFVLCLSVAYSQICSGNSFCETQFQIFTDLQLSGCVPSDILGQSSLACARSCSANQNCTAFNHDDTICKTCTGSLVTGLTFVTGQNIFLQRTMKGTNLYYDPGTLHIHQVLPIPEGISIGRVGYLQATLLTSDSFDIDFAQDFAVLTSNFHFRARWDSNSNRQLVMNHCKNGIWGSPEVSPPFPFPFTVGMAFTLHVLVTPKSFDVYINGVYCCYYNHTLAVGDVRYMRVTGNLNVHEISV